MNLYDLASLLAVERKAPSHENVQKINKIMNTPLKELIDDSFLTWQKLELPKLIQQIGNLPVPGYTENYKKRVMKSHKQWGDYGWTYNDEADSSVFDDYPNSLEEADKKMLRYCTMEHIDRMQDELEQAGINIADLEEARCCYNAGNYKACCLILFSLIDGDLISRGYRYWDKRGQCEGTTKNGLSAVITLKDDSTKLPSNAMLFFQLYIINIHHCLMAMFAGTNDWHGSQAVINRNYLTHGMCQRAVNKVDCFKVWSALYSLKLLYPELEAMN